LILSNNGDVYDGEIASKASDAIFKAVKSGAIAEDRINDSWARIEAIKEKFGIIGND
jgi:hypothetical protein